MELSEQAPRIRLEIHSETVSYFVSSKLTVAIRVENRHHLQSNHGQDDRTFHR